jgi:hypothetical protein
MYPHLPGQRPLQPETPFPQPNVLPPPDIPEPEMGQSVYPGDTEPTSKEQTGMAPPAWAGNEVSTPASTDHTAAAVGAAGAIKTVGRITVNEGPRHAAEEHGPTAESHFRYNVDPEKSFGLTPAEVDTKYREARQVGRYWAQEFEGQRALTQQEVDQISKFNEALINIGNNELGVDLRERITALEDIHVFPTLESYTQAVFSQTKNHSTALGLHIPHAGILVREDGDTLDRRVDTLYIILHEEVHDLSQMQIAPVLEQDASGNVTVDIATSMYTLGYRGIGQVTPHGGNEAVTDMLTHRGMVASGLGRIMPGYAVSSLLLGGVIEDTADNLSTRGRAIHPQDVENLITRGMLVADTTGLAMIDRALSPNATRILMNTSAALYLDESAGIASTIRSPAAEEVLWARHEGREVDWFTWR